MFVLARIWSPITVSCSAWHALYDGTDGPRPGSRSGFPYVESDGPCLVARRFARAQERRRSPTAPGSRLLGGTHQGGVILGFVLGSAGHPRRL
jgi:hypothetical protein